MEAYTDVAGCNVYDRSTPAAYRRSRSLSNSSIRFKTYTTNYFETNKELDIDNELLDTNSYASSSPPPPVIHSRTPSMSHSNPHRPSLGTQRPSFGANLNVPGVAGSNVSSGLGHHAPPHSPNFSINLPAPGSASPSGGRSPGWSTNYGSSYGGPSGNGGYAPSIAGGSSLGDYTSSRTDLPLQKPQIVINTFGLDSGHQHNGSGTTSGGIGGSNFLSLPSASLYATSPGSSRGGFSSAISSPGQLSAISPSFEPFGHYQGHPIGSPGGRSPSASSALSDPFDELHESAEAYAQVPSSVLATLKMLPQAQDGDEHYMKHFFAVLAGQLNYPDRGFNNPFRQLLTTLCSDDAAMLHAVLAYAATDLHYNVQNHPTVDSTKALGQAEMHTDVATRMLIEQLEDAKWRQSTAALATCYFVNLTRAKNLQQIDFAPAMRAVEARAQAGRIFEGGIWLTWANAVLSINSGFFGGTSSVMLYLIEHELLPTPGQGNMYPFVKKTEDERIEHTVISPMFHVLLKCMTAQAQLSKLASGLAPLTSPLSPTSPTSPDRKVFEAELQRIYAEVEEAWAHRPKIVDELMKEQIDEIFLNRWIGAVPTAHWIVCNYHMTRLLCEVLMPGSVVPQEALNTSSLVIARIFNKAVRDRKGSLRRGTLAAVILAALTSPDLSLRQGLGSLLNKCAANEPSWKRAAAVVMTSVRAQRDEIKRGGSVKSVDWQELRSTFNGLVML
ncbi:hypothetical protein PYCC9005_000239 [Savitreella phatthalungensis]